MSESLARFSRAFAACPLVAVLRGLTPGEAPAIGDALVDAGFTILEVPLNSPDPFESIGLLAERLAGRALVGAGTVLKADEVRSVRDAGGEIIVSPDVNVEVIRATVSGGLVSLPGYLTPTEALAALDAGAHALKLFPVEGLPLSLLKAQRAVLPAATKVLAVGGITPGNIADWRRAGANGFGIGSNLFYPGKDAADVARDAMAFVAAVQEDSQ